MLTFLGFCVCRLLSSLIDIYFSSSTFPGVPTGTPQTTSFPQALLLLGVLTGSCETAATETSLQSFPGNGCLAPLSRNSGVMGWVRVFGTSGRNWIQREHRA